VWMFLAVNTLLTASIMWKILYVPRHRSSSDGRNY
jgi:hypothetical protein